VLVLLGGLPGVGKSAIAAGVARRLHVPVVSVDPIGAAIVRSGIPQSLETGLADRIAGATSRSVRRTTLGRRRAASR